MKLVRLPALLAVAFMVVGGQAHAQNFFERLFGIVPDRQPPPVYNYPSNAPPPSSRGFDGPVDDEGRRPSAPAAPAVAKPVTIRAPADDNVLGRELKQNGSGGSLRFERAGRDLRVRMTLVGRKGAGSPETCAVQLGGGDAIPLVAQGRPDGVQRFQLPDPTCPLQLDVLDESVLVKGPEGVCTFPVASCEIDPGGLWGPEPAQLLSRARDYEQSRASADKAVRDNYKVLVQRARPDGVRPIVAEQAAFSADRETVCRSYAREGATSFCNARYSEARALALAARLGVASTSSTASAEPRPRRRSADPYALPPSDELMQRRRDDD